MVCSPRQLVAKIRTRSPSAASIVGSAVVPGANSWTEAEQTALAKASQNPVASLISLPFELNYNGDFRPNNGNQAVLNIKPVIPVALNENWNLINRLIVHVVSQQGIPGDPTRQNGLGDSVYQALISSSQSEEWIWGVVPQISIPTHTDETLGSRAFGGGFDDARELSLRRAALRESRGVSASGRFISRPTAEERTAAEAVLVELADHAIDAAQITNVGDSIMLQDYFGDRSVETLAKEFGPAFAQSIATVEPGSWQGPLESGLGWHLVFVDSLEPGRVPDFSEVEPEVRNAWLAEQKEMAWLKAYDDMRAKYAVLVPVGPEEDLASAPTGNVSP